MEKARCLIVAICLTIGLFGCTEKIPKYQLVETKDGKSTYLDSISGVLIFVNKSNRVDDYVDLKLDSAEISRIKANKDKNDAAQKMRDWDKIKISGTKYQMSLKTRYYKDRLLFITDIEPYDDSLRYKASTIQIDLLDTSGFSLEKIIPGSWTRVIDDKGNAVMLEYSGELPMTLENYLEITSWNINWRF